MTNKTEIVQFRADSSLVAQLMAIAAQRNTPCSAMLRSWVTERAEKEFLVSGERRQAERLEWIEAKLNDDFEDGPVLIVRMIPLMPKISLNMSAIAPNKDSLAPVTERTRGVQGRLNSNGFEALVERYQGKQRAHTQVFSNGMIESIQILSHKDVAIYALMVDHAIVDAVQSYAAILSGQQVPVPAIVSIALIRVRDHWLMPIPQAVRTPRAGFHPDYLPLSDVLITDWSQVSKYQDTAQHLRPTLDAIWCASGFNRSYTFDDRGRWHGPFA